MRSQICKNCAFYTAYYKQWAASYGRLNNGFCARCQKPRTQFETCEDFKDNEIKEERREKRMYDSLEQALKSINEIALILKEKEREKNLQ